LNFLNWGPAGGDFLTDNPNTIFTINFVSSDIYDNYFNIGENSDNLVTKSLIKVSKNGVGVPFTMKKNSDLSYQFSMNVSRPGDYKIDNIFFPSSKPYYVRVYPGSINIINSSCKIANDLSTGAIDNKIQVTFTCTLNDQWGNTVDIPTLEKWGQLNKYCTVMRGKDQNSYVKILDVNSSNTSSSNIFNCFFTTDGNGFYKIQAFYKMGNTAFPNQQSYIEILSNLNVFKVISTPINFTGSKIYDFSLGKFINNQSELLNNISFTSDNNVPITLISLADESGSESADIGYGPNFSLADFSGTFTNSHATNVRPISTLKFEQYILPSNGKIYIAVSFNNQKDVIIRNSFYYLLSLKYKNSSMNIRVNYPTLYNNGQTVCLHDLKIENTSWIKTDIPTNVFNNNDYVYIGNIVLRTTDNNLFNNFIASSRLTYNLTPNIDSTRVVITQDPAVAGYYKVYVQGTIQSDYSLNLLIDSFTFTTKYTFSILPQTMIYNIFTSINNKYKTSVTDSSPLILIDTTADDTPIIQFTGSDSYKNSIKYAPNSGNNFLGIGLDISVGENRIVERINSSSVNFSWNGNNYQLEDNNKVAGNYIVKISSVNGLLTYKYYKKPGLPSNISSFAVLNNSNVIRLSEQVIVALNLRDKFNNLISLDSDLFNSELKKINVYALYQDNVTKVNFTLGQNIAINPIYTGTITEKAGKYTIKVEYSTQNGIVNFNCNSCIFEATYEKFDLNKCKLFIVTSKPDLLTQDAITNINNVNDVPLFNFKFFDTNEKELFYVDNKSNLKAFITGANNFRLDLNTEWLKSYQIFWTMPDVNVSEDKKFKNLKGDNYILNISFNDLVALKYTLKLLGDGNDQDAGNGQPDLTKTYFNEPNINAVAGYSYSTTIEFRTELNLRVNFYEDILNFSFKNSANLDNKKFNIITQKGPKRGTYILAIYSEVAFLPSNPLMLTILFKNVEIQQKIRISVKHNELSSIELLPTSIKNANDFTLIDCSVENENLFYLQAYDKFKNIFLDLYDIDIYSINRIKSLFNIQHSDNFQILINSGVSANKDKFFISIISRNKGIITFTSTFLNNQIWKINFSPGAFDTTVSYGIVTPLKLLAGELIRIDIYLRDKYNNEIRTENALSVFNNTEITFIRQADILKLDKSMDVQKNTFYSIFNSDKKGAYNFRPTYSGIQIKCDNCQAIVFNSNYVFKKSNLVYISSSSTDNSVQTVTNPFELSKTNLPTFGLSLYDTKDNIYDQIPEDFVVSAQLLQSDSQVALPLCSEKNNNILNIFICRDTKSRNTWKFLLNGKYIIKIEDKSPNANVNDKFLTYNMNVVNGALDPNASNGDVDPLKTVFSVQELNTVAGEYGQFNVEIRTTDNKRKYAWEDDPKSYIVVSFSKNIENNYFVDVNLGEIPGVYVVKISSKKSFTISDNNFISFKINNVDLFNKVKLITVPNNISYSNFVDDKGQKLSALPSGSADDTYKLLLKIYDKFDNLITPKTSSINFNVIPPSAKSNFSIISSFILNQDSTVQININAIFSGTYTIKSSLFSNINFDIFPGIPSSNNSLAIADSEIIAGGNAKLYIIPFDKNNNLIDAENTKTKETYKASYKYKIKDDYVSYLIISDPTMEQIEFPKNSKSLIKAFVFTTQLKYKGQNFFRVIIFNNEIKCVNCITNVIPAEPDFKYFLFTYFDPTKASFTELIENTYFDNRKTEPIIRVYPRDRYLNLISLISGFGKYSLTFTDNKNIKNIYKFKVSNNDDNKQEYIQFIQNDIFEVNKDLFFNTLTKGDYTLTITENSLFRNNKVFLLGTDSDSDASNDELDITKTVITDSVLEFTAGLDGRLIIELRTITNLRKNNWFYKVDVQPLIEDKTFSKKINNATKLGQYLISFGSQKANTFPTYFEYGLKITINGQEVLGLKPLIKINPDVMAKSFIVDSYLKTASGKEINDGTSDKNVEFSIQAKDQYDNITKVNTELLKLSIYSPDNIRVTYTSDGQYSASLGFSADTRKAGKYSFNGNTLPNYTYQSNPGKLNFDNSIVYNQNIKVIAGQSASVVIVPKDKNLNEIDSIQVLSSMKVTIKTPKKNLDLISNGKDDGKRIIYSLPLEERGINRWTILIDNKLKSCESCLVEVVPDKASAEKSLIYLLDEVNNNKIIINNNSEIQVSNKFPLNIFISLRDKFENLIDLLTDNINIINPVFTGLDIENINLIISRTADNSQFWLKIPQEKTRIFNHLISGRNYLLKFSVRDELNLKDFNYPINILSDRDDSEAGNGNYLVENTYISDTLINLYADNRKSFVMRLKTAKKLLFNDDIDIDNDIKYRVEPADDTFELKISRDFTKYNYYTITVLSKKSLIDSSLSLTLLIKNPIKNDSFIEVPQKINLTIKPKMPPFAPKTKIITMPPEKESLKPKQQITITFNLFDEYGNMYNKNTDILKYLQIINNNKETDKNLEQVIFQLRNDGITYEASFIPIYPPKTVDFYVNYFDQENKIMLNILNRFINRNIVSTPDYKFTKITGDNLYVMKAGEKINLFVNFYDSYNACVDIENEIPILAKIRGPLNISDLSLQNVFNYNFKKNIISNENTECKSNYIMDVPNDKIHTFVGDYEITVYVGSQQEKLNPIIQKLIPGELDISKTLSKYSEDSSLKNNKFKAGEKFNFSIIGYDKYQNPINSSLKNLFNIVLKNKFSNIELKSETNYNINIQEEKIGQLNSNLIIKKPAGKYTLDYIYKGETVNLGILNGPKEFEILPNICSFKKPLVDKNKFDKAISGEPTYLTIICQDEFENRISTGGEIFSSKIQATLEGDKTTEVSSKITDNKDGTYKIEFTPPLKGNYQIKILLNKDEYYTISNKQIGDLTCEDKTMFRCTNNIEKCVKDLKDCLSPNPEINCQTDKEKPIGCRVNGNNVCVKSKNECDCPENLSDRNNPYIKCPSTNVCILKNRYESMCFDPLPIDCFKKYPTFKIFNNDGICRSSDESPNQRVCPLGYVICPDLTCRQNMAQCQDYDDCKDNEIRCSDMSCSKDQKDCPSTITCPKVNQFVCPDGICVNSELECKRLPVCNEPFPYLCSQNVCSKDYKSCPKSISCGTGKALCSDMICRASCRNQLKLLVG